MPDLLPGAERDLVDLAGITGTIRPVLDGALLTHIRSVPCIHQSNVTICKDSREDKVQKIAGPLHQLQRRTRRFNLIKV